MSLAAHVEISAPARHHLRHRLWRRALLAAVLLISCVAFTAGDAKAQLDEDDDDGIPVDTTAVEELIEAISPKYETSYNVTRQKTDWEQQLKFGTSIRGWSLTNTTRFKIGNDNQRDSQTRDGGTQGSLRGRPVFKLPLTLDYRVNRTSVDQPSVRTENNRSSFGLSTKTTKKIGGIRHTVDLQTGLDTNNSLSSTAASTSDTREQGFRGQGSWRGSWSPRDDLSIESSLSEERTKSNSELEKSGVDTLRSENTSRESRNLTVSVQYDPAAWVTSKVAYSKRKSDDEFFQVQTGGGELEQKITENESMSLNMAFTPRENLEFTWAMGASEDVRQQRVRDDLSSQGDGDDWEAGLKTEIWGTDVQTNLSRERRFTDPMISIGHETIFKVLEGRFSRPLTKKFDGRFNFELRLRQQFFRGSQKEIQDKDELKTKFDTGLNYKPGGKWSANISYINENTSKIEANEIRATETNDEENHTVTVAIKYQMSARTTVTQNYSIQAAFTTFPFDETRNRLDQTQRIVTNIGSQITPKVRFSMSHNYNLINTGPFSIGPSGERRFARNSRSFRQDLTSKLEYKVWEWLTLSSEEQFTRNDRVNEATDVVSVRKNLELRQGFKVQKTLGSGVAMRADGAYVRSSTTDSYWSLTSSLNKDF